MTILQSQVSFKDHADKRTEVDIDVTDYMEAADNKLSLSQHYARKYPTREDQPTAFEQFIAASGIRLRADPARGITASSMKEVLHGNVDKSMGTIIRGTGADRQTTAGRILYPEIMLQLINANLIDNKDDYLIPWENAIAIKTSVTGPRVDQPTINVRAPEASAAMPIGQLSEPAVMISISLGSRTYTIPTKAIGLEISDQALEATTIDRVGLTLAAQARGERIRRIEEDMTNIISGDVDYNVAAVTFANASTFDATIPGTNPILTHKAFVKWLREKYQTMTISHILADIDTALAIDGRTGRPQVLNDTSARQASFPVDYTIENMGLPSPRLLLLPTSIIGANRVVGFDSRYALHEITNVSASYSAIENYIMRRATQLRFDYGIILVKEYPEAFTGLTLAA